MKGVVTVITTIYDLANKKVMFFFGLIPLDIVHGISLYRTVIGCIDTYCDSVL